MSLEQECLICGKKMDFDWWYQCKGICVSCKLNPQNLGMIATIKRKEEKRIIKTFQKRKEVAEK